MKRLAWMILLGAAALNTAPPHTSAKPRAAARAARRSVLDYYYLLPYLGNAGSETRRDKSRLLKPGGEGFTPIVDLRHDYIEVWPDSAPVEQIAVFRSAGPDLIATSSPDYESDYNQFKLWRLQNGKLRDVTRQALPASARGDDLAFELPRVGTTIHAFRFSLEPRSRKPAFNLLWRGGRLVMQRLR